VVNNVSLLGNPSWSFSLWIILGIIVSICFEKSSNVLVCVLCVSSSVFGAFSVCLVCLVYVKSVPVVSLVPKTAFNVLISC
jgi:hypothetical protein